MDIVVIGGTNIDYMVHGPNLPCPGETVQEGIFCEGFGGKGANQAIASARLGSQVAFISKVGADSRGDAALENLRREGIDTTYVFRDDSAPTGVALISVNKKGEKQISWAPGANHKLRLSEILSAREIIHRAKVVLIQLELPLETVTAAIEIAAESNAKIILDPAPPTYISSKLLRLIDVVKPNRHEAEYLTGLSVYDRSTARLAGEKLLFMGVKAAIIQAGNEGNLLLSNQHEVWFPRIQVNSVDATGAGDAFAGALSFALAKGYSLDDAAQFGDAAATLKTTVIGAQAGLPSYDAMLSFLKSNEIQWEKRKRVVSGKDNA
ncbi:MAG: ribokinase [Bdellovibrionia bacterium]